MHGKMTADEKFFPNFMGIKYTDQDVMHFNLAGNVGGHGHFNMLFGRDEMMTS